MAAGAKLLETWKALNEIPYTLGKLFKLPENSTGTTRASTRNDLQWSSMTKKAEKGFVQTASRLWNSAPLQLREARTRRSAKKIISNFTQQLPV